MLDKGKKPPPPPPALIPKTPKETEKNHAVKVIIKDLNAKEVCGFWTCVKCHTIPSFHNISYTMPCHTLYHLQYHTIFYSVLFYFIIIYCIVLYCIALHCIALRCIVWYGMVLYHTMPYHTIPHGITTKLDQTRQKRVIICWIQKNILQFFSHLKQMFI